MSVCVTVGWNVDFDDGGCEEETFTEYSRQFAALAEFAESRGVKGYREPQNGETWSAQLLPGNGVLYLQRLAWRLWEDILLEPCDEQAPADAIFDSMLDDLPGLCGTKNAKGQGFDHLVHHSVEGGSWLPVDFEEPIYGGDDFGWMIGSSVRLKSELEAVAEAIELDLTMWHDDKTVWHARDYPEEGREKWQRYGVESFNCLRMYRACQKSIELGAAIRFS